MKLNQSRLQHSLAVARKMESIVRKNADAFDCTPEEAFCLGFVHDLGYEFCDIGQSHEIIGGEILHDSGYIYWKEVFYHGNPNSSYSSIELDLLNFADMTTGPNGENMTFKDRLNDIRERYGQYSEQYINATLMVNRINNSPVQRMKF